jgi:hypothetical protein
LVSYSRNRLDTADSQVISAQDAPEDSPEDVAAGPLPGLWDTFKRDVKAFPSALWTDTRTVYTSESNLVLLGVSYGGALALQQTGVDNSIEHSFETHNTFKAGFRDAMGVAGSPLTHFGLAGLWYVIGQQTDDTHTYEVGCKLFRAVTLTGASTVVGKLATWEDAPNGEWGAFPSGHTGSTFAVASVMHHEYGPWVGVPMYALGGLVAYARLEDHEHYFSDVVFGGVLGLVIGHTVAADEEPLKLFGGDIVPYVDALSGRSGVGWRYSL